MKQHWFVCVCMGQRVASATHGDTKRGAACRGPHTERICICSASDYQGSCGFSCNFCMWACGPASICSYARHDAIHCCRDPNHHDHRQHHHNNNNHRIIIINIIITTLCHHPVPPSHLLPKAPLQCWLCGFLFCQLLSLQCKWQREGRGCGDWGLETGN